MAEESKTWFGGDPVIPGAPAFDPTSQSAVAQARQFGYNNDYIGFLALPFGSGSSRRGLLCVNHEYTSEEVMFPGVGKQLSKDDFSGMTAELVDVEMAAHGNTIIEISRGGDGKWRTHPDSRFNRRITASTPMRISGPAAGHARMKTSADPSGTRVLGTIDNCAGDTLARLRRWHAAAPVGGGHHQARRRRDRELAESPHLRGTAPRRPVPLLVGAASAANAMASIRSVHDLRNRG